MPPSESKQVLKAFEAYRNLGFNRTIAKLAKVLGKKPSILWLWSARYRWHEKVRTFDRLMYDYYTRLMSQSVGVKSRSETEAAYQAALDATLKHFSGEVD